MKVQRSTLIVEPTPNKRSLLADLVGELGFAVIATASLDEALARLGMIIFDALFVEASLANDAPFSFIRNLRGGRGDNRRAPIIVVSVDRQEAMIKKVRDCGANGFLARPFSRGMLQLQIVRIANDPRAFIETEEFRGPDRRRWCDPTYCGPERRRANSHYLD